MNSKQTKSTAQKSCFVPGCSNNTTDTPEKLFIYVPRNEERRKRWFTAVGRPYDTSKRINCCEDHFDLPNDAENWMYYQIFRGHLYMKKHVVPHIAVPNQLDPLEILPSDVKEFEKNTRQTNALLNEKSYMAIPEGNQQSHQTFDVITLRPEDIKVEEVDCEEENPVDEEVLMVIPPGSYNFVKVLREGEDENIPEENQCSTQ